MAFVAYHRTGRDARERIIALDIGGSRLRWGVVNEHRGQFEVGSRGEMSISRQDFRPGTLAKRITEIVSPLLEGANARTCAISLGAAMDARDGAVLGSGPMWGGPGAGRMFIERDLHEVAPSVDWRVENDLTAHALGVSQTCAMPNSERIGILNLGTGIAFRTLSLQPLGIWVDDLVGLQGEVGHLPAACSIDDVYVHRACDCGEMDHLSSFAAGAAIEGILHEHAARFPFVETDGDNLRAFSAAVAAGDPDALRLLDCLMKPVAIQVRQILTIDPAIGRIFLVGGVSDGLRTPLLTSLRRQFVKTLHPYGLGRGHVHNLEDLLAQVPSTSETALVGAAFSALCRPRPMPVSGSWRQTGSRFMSQDVVLDPGCLQSAESASLRGLVRTLTPGRQMLVLQDTNVKLEQVKGLLNLLDEATEGNVSCVQLELAESSKTIASAFCLLDEFNRAGVDRRSAQIIAIGGGVVLDVVGYAASQYRRGVPYVAVPSTLIGMIDAGIALKRSLNIETSKHRIGSYWPPTQTIIDPRLLTSLPIEQYRYGLAEAIKVALIADAALFDLIEVHGKDLLNHSATAHVEDELVRRSLSVMLAELEKNPFEHDLRRPVDLGHSLISKLELDDVRPMPHGVAVAFDMAVTACLSHRRNLLGATPLGRILRLLHRCGLYPAIDSRSHSLAVESLAETTLHRMGQKLPLLRDIGVRPVFVDDVTSEEIGLALELLADGFHT